MGHRIIDVWAWSQVSGLTGERAGCATPMEYLVPGEKCMNETSETEQDEKGSYSWVGSCESCWGVSCESCWGVSCGSCWGGSCEERGDKREASSPALLSIITSINYSVYSFNNKKSQDVPGKLDV